MATARLQLVLMLLRAPLVWLSLPAPSPCLLLLALSYLLLLALPMAPPLLQRHEKKTPEVRLLLALMLNHSSPPLVLWRPPGRRRTQVCVAPVCRAAALAARVAPLAPTRMETPMGSLLPVGC